MKKNSRNLGPLDNPFRPGAGHQPPYLAGRVAETSEFSKLLTQKVILQNAVLTGLRGVGKTVLLDRFKPLAIEAGWLWAGTDLSESTSVSEDSLALRLITDLSVVTAQIPIHQPAPTSFLRQPGAATTIHSLDFRALRLIYADTPGLIADKLKAVLEVTWAFVSKIDRRGIVFAYDEAQNLADHAQKEQYPLSLLLDVFQSIQRKGVPFILVLTGLPTLFPKLVEARTFAERMFHIITLGALTRDETGEAVEVPIRQSRCPFSIESASVDVIWTETKGYPYFIQFVCKEIFDVWVLQASMGETLTSVPTDEIFRKLDADFFVGRWARATDRQRELLAVIASLENSDSEFTVQEIVAQSREDFPERPFSSSHANQMLSALIERGLIYKNRHGKYSFAVPLFDRFIMRQLDGGVQPPLE
jgi:hypothetical protein